MSTYDAEAQRERLLAILAMAGVDRRSELATALRRAHAAGVAEGMAVAWPVVEAAQGAWAEAQRGQYPPGYKGQRAGGAKVSPGTFTFLRRWLARPLAALTPPETEPTPEEPDPACWCVPQRPRTAPHGPRCRRENATPEEEP